MGGASTSTGDSGSQLEPEVLLKRVFLVSWFSQDKCSCIGPPDSGVYSKPQDYHSDRLMPFWLKTFGNCSGRIQSSVVTKQLSGKNCWREVLDVVTAWPETRCAPKEVKGHDIAVILPDPLVIALERTTSLPEKLV